MQAKHLYNQLPTLLRSACNIHANTLHQTYVQPLQLHPEGSLSLRFGKPCSTVTIVVLLVTPPPSITMMLSQQAGTVWHARTMPATVQYV
jgi:hypothetical protein